MRTGAPSETKKCAHGEDFRQKTFDLSQFGHFSGKSPPIPRPILPCRTKNSAMEDASHDENTGRTGRKTGRCLHEAEEQLDGAARPGWNNPDWCGWGDSNSQAEALASKTSVSTNSTTSAFFHYQQQTAATQTVVCASLILTTRERSGYRRLNEQALGKAKAAFYWISQRNAAFFCLCPGAGG